MEWAQVLVIILSVFLAIFLLLGIILTVLLIKVTRQIKSITGVAQRTADKLESAAANVAAYSSPIAIVKTVMAFVKKKK